MARFLLGLDLGAAARFDGAGEPVPGRAAQGDAAGWVAAAARAAGVPAPSRAVRLAGPRRLPGEIPRRLPRQRPGLRSSQAELHRFFDPPGGDSMQNAGAGGGVTWCAGPAAGLGARLGGGLGGAALRAAGSLPGGAAHAAAPRRRRRPLRHRPFRRTGLRSTPGPRRPPGAPGASPRSRAGDRRASTAARDRAAALRLLADLRRAATPAGLLPERVDARTGVPALDDAARLVPRLRRARPAPALARTPPAGEPVAQPQPARPVDARPTRKHSEPGERSSSRSISAAASAPPEPRPSHSS